MPGEKMGTVLLFEMPFGFLEKKTVPFLWRSVY
jgi:hypothetical protein